MSSIDRGSMPPPFGQKELKQREKAKRRRDDALKRSTSLTTGFMTFCGVGSSVGYVASMLGNDGFGVIDGLVCAGLGVGVYLGISHLWRMGSELLPEKPLVEREAMVPAYVTGMGLWCLVSVGSTGAWLAYPSAAVADLNKRTEYVIEQSIEIEAAHQRLYALIPSLRTQATTIIGAAELEGETGGFCQTGRGRGGCYTGLRTLAVQTSGTAKDLESEQRENVPTMERMAANRESIRRIMENDGLSYDEKAERVTELRESIVTDSKTLTAALNIQSVRQLRDVYTADFSAAGFSPVGTNRLHNMLSSSVANLDQAVREGVRDSEVVMKSSDPMFPLAVIFRNLDTVWPMALLSALPEFVTAFLVFFAFLTTRREDDEDVPPSPATYH